MLCNKHFVGRFGAMTKKLGNRWLVLRDGFTLVELVVTFAIGGLFVVLVFLAVSSAQRGAREGLRKTYLQQVAANVEKYKEAAANNYQYPTTAPAFITAFSSGGSYNVSGNDPSTGTSYVMGTSTAGVAPAWSQANVGTVYYQYGYTCNGTSQFTNYYRLYMNLESNNTMYCLDNH